MRLVRFSWHHYLIGALIVLALIGIGAARRLPLFHTSSYMSLFALDKAKELYQGQAALWLTPDAKIKQSFVSKYPGLDQIGVFLTSQAKASGAMEVVFHLKEICDAPTDVRRITATISTADVRDDAYYPFTFTPVDESTDKKFCFVLESAQDLDEEKLLGVRASQADVYTEGQALYQAPEETTPAIRVNPVALKYQIFLPIVQTAKALPKEMDVGFELHYNGRLFDTFGVFVGRLVEHKPYIWGQPIFYLGLLVIYVIGLFFLLRIKPD
jgi:hypothetical protein